MIQEFYPPILGQLYNGTGVHFNPLYLLEDNNRTAPLQNVGRGFWWFTSEEKSCKTIKLIPQVLSHYPV